VNTPAPDTYPTVGELHAALKELYLSYATGSFGTQRQGKALKRARKVLERAQRAPAPGTPITNEAIERALDHQLTSLDRLSLRYLVRGDTMPIGWAKTDVVRALLVALGVLPRAEWPHLTPSKKP
jgi:hypothetical protein